MVKPRPVPPHVTPAEARETHYQLDATVVDLQDLYTVGGATGGVTIIGSRVAERVYHSRRRQPVIGNLALGREVSFAGYSNDDRTHTAIVRPTDLCGRHYELLTGAGVLDPRGQAPTQYNLSRYQLVVDGVDPRGFTSNQIELLEQASTPHGVRFTSMERGQLGFDLRIEEPALAAGVAIARDMIQIARDFHPDAQG